MNVFIESLDEFHMLARFALEIESEFRLTGSVARTLLALAHENSDTECGPPEWTSSMLDYVPAFADIDILTETDDAAYRLTSMIVARIPYARFFRWDIRARTTEEPTDSPAPEGEIAFGLGKSQAGIRCVVTPGPADSIELSKLEISVSETDSPEFVARNAKTGEGGNPLVELLVLARRFPCEVDADAGRILKHRIESTRVINELAVRRRRHEALQFAALELAFNIEHHRLPPWFRDLCYSAATKTWNQHLRELLQLCAAGEDANQVVAIVRPEHIAGRWHRRLYDVRQQTKQWETESRDFLHAITGANAQNNGPPRFLSPLLDFEVEPPSDPCCGYQDFSCGIIEIAWRSAPCRSPSSSHFAIVELSEGRRTAANQERRDDQLALTHAYTTFGKAGMMRTDYGFLSVLASKRRALRLLGGLSEQHALGGSSQ